MNTKIIPASSGHQAIIDEMQALLDALRPQLIESEAGLTDRLAAIHAFEFQIRSRLEKLSRRLDDLQQQIKQYRHRLRFLQNEWVDEWPPDNAAERIDFSDAGRASSGNYRYRQQVSQPKGPVLPAEELANLKQFYRELARRFHPDLAQNEEDRTYRTGLMTAINAAYLAGDWPLLQKLALEPDSISHIPDTDEALAAALTREVERCRARLTEIEQELLSLEQHASTQLMRRAELATAEGWDLLAQLATDLQHRISESLIERDILKIQVEEQENGEAVVVTADLADAVYDLGLEQAGEDDLFADLSFSNQQGNRARNGRIYDEDILDDRE